MTSGMRLTLVLVVVSLVYVHEDVYFSSDNTYGGMLLIDWGIVVNYVRHTEGTGIGIWV